MKHLFQFLIASLLLLLVAVCSVLGQATCPADRSVCANEAPFALSGASPAGGTYSGPGVSGGIFSPAIAGTGAKTITYTYQDGENNVSCTFIITVNPAPEKMEVLGLIPVCIDESANLPEYFGTIKSFYTIPSEPVSVSWSGAGITGDSVTGYQFNPAMAGTGFHNIYATATTSQGCTSGPFASSIAVDGQSAVSCPGDTTISVLDSAFTLTGAKNLTVSGLPSSSGNPTTADAGGIYAGIGVNSATSTFDPSVAGEGAHQITYTVDTGCGPAASCIFNVRTTPMPVRLVSFMAKKNENKILLSWKTSEETGFDRFEIEKSESPDKRFVNIGHVAGKGAKHAYSFLDDSAIAPGTTVYYRLKMVDLDGTYAYSKIVREGVDGINVTMVYPNPVSGELSIFSQSDLVDIQLINSKNVTVMAQKPDRSKINRLDISRLPVGTYIVRTTDIDGRMHQSKVVIQR
ncbi:T9SS type A sorting domain-containing protein [Dyadobacter sp. 676]|uniref:T9SS type A sorting domain-containing protein n=1 Tax=Dyadobacter sp. 676 TaxID=3088362 RepID=A0AAU8FLS3_9BACT